MYNPELRAKCISDAYLREHNQIIFLFSLVIWCTSSPTLVVQVHHALSIDFFP